MNDRDTNQTQAAAPVYIAYQINEGSEANHWTRIGAAWKHKDEKGFSLKLDCIPVNGRVSLRLAEYH